MPPAPVNQFDRFRIASRAVLSYGGEKAATGNFPDYTAFPTGVRAPNGDLLTFFFRGPLHNAPPGYVAMNRSTDDGASWGNVVLDERPIHHAASTSYASLPGGATVLRSGRILLPVMDEFFTTSAPDRASLMMHSDDSGYTWSSTVALPQLGTQHTSVGGKAVEMPDGTVLLPLSYYNTGANYSPIVLVQSLDHGQTWSLFSTVASTPAVQYTEPVCGLLNDARMMCLFRSTTSTLTVVSTFSSDGGVTWTPPVRAFSGASRPHWTQTRRGVIVAASRRPSTPFYLEHSPGYLYVSTDAGATWPLAIPAWDSAYEPTGGGYLYGDAFLLGEDKIGVIQAQGSARAAYNLARLEYITIDDSLTTPAQILGTNLWAWYDIQSVIDANPGNTSGRVAIYRWSDQSIAHRDLISTTLPFYLLWGSRTSGGFQGLQVLDSNDVANAQLEVPVALPQPFAITMALHAWSPNQTLILFDDGIGTAGDIVINDVTSLFLATQGTYVRFATKTTPGVPAWPPGAVILTTIFNGAQSAVRINGVVIPRIPGASNLSMRAMSTFRFGGQGHATLAGDLREIVISTTTNAATLGQLEALLMEKHRLP